MLTLPITLVIINLVLIKETKMEPLKKAITTVGGQRELARICGVSQVAVSKWLNGVSKIGEDKAILLEQALNGLVTCEELRPDVNWSVIRGRA
jgi:DNA-binding transcriptional regulator YdaS (Cro superfamily)